MATTIEQSALDMLNLGRHPDGNYYVNILSCDEVVVGRICALMTRSGLQVMITKIQEGTCFVSATRAGVESDNFAWSEEEIMAIADDVATEAFEAAVKLGKDAKIKIAKQEVRARLEELAQEMQGLSVLDPIAVKLILQRIARYSVTQDIEEFSRAASSLNQR